MKLLLDTHTFLWFIGGSPLLSLPARQLIEDSENERFLSLASLWEMAIKISLGKLEIASPTFQALVDDHVAGNAISLLAIEAHHLDILTHLPFHHRDPFDRLIIAQGAAEGAAILSRDEAFDLYGAQRVW